MIEESSFYLDHVQLIIFFGIWSFLAFWIMGPRHFFTLPPHDEKKHFSLAFFQLLIVFSFYIILSLLVSHLLASFLSSFSLRPIVLAGVMQFILMASLLIFLVSYSLIYAKGIWKRGDQPLFQDVKRGALTWLMGFPIASLLGQLGDLFVYASFGVEDYEQVAVRFLKLMLTTPETLFLALFTICIAAPIVEEILFRGFLQTWIRHYLGSRSAILISSLAFALFHYDVSQGFGNIPLMIMLFVLALFLGFLYEKQRSLFAPITLHMTFNAISIVMIIFSN